MSVISAAYQGIPGCHSQQVLKFYCEKLKIEHSAVGLASFRQVATDVVGGKADIGILPIDNAIAGTVRDSYDLLAQYDLVPISEVEWRMDHRLLSVEGARPEGIREILAHPLVLEECGKFLGAFVGIKVIPCEDTGLAAREVAERKDPKVAAIAPPEAAKIYQLTELAENIADHPENFTRFMIFRSQNASEAVTKLARAHSPQDRKTSVLLSAAHQRGSLARCLRILDEAGINLSKLESCPRLGKAWEYLFYIDLEGDLSEPRVSGALENLRKESNSLQVIGSYDRHRALKERTFSDVGLSCGPSTPLCQTEEGWSADLLPSSSKSWPKASRASKPQGSRIPVGGVILGGSDFTVMAGPCSVESREQMMAVAYAVKEAGAVMLRGGAFKPRTNPYAFQGLGWSGVSLLAEAGRATGMPTISEVMSIDQVERMAREIDVLQIGARNMQNFELLRAVGKIDRPILLKRAMSGSLDELLAAAEYILAEGNPHVILCERGIRTFETSTRNTLDISAVPVLRERTHLPIVIDPSHAVGVRRWIRPLCRAAKAVGAHGIILEVHPNPEEAKSDKDQALTFEDFKMIMNDLAQIPSVL